MSNDLTRNNVLGALVQGHITTFPDGGYGCLRCAAMSPPPAHDGMRTMLSAAQDFVAVHEKCAQPINQDIAAFAVGLRSGVGRA